MKVIQHCTLPFTTPCSECYFILQHTDNFQNWRTTFVCFLVFSFWNLDLLGLNRHKGYTPLLTAPPLECDVISQHTVHFHRWMTKKMSLLVLTLIKNIAPKYSSINRSNWVIYFLLTTINEKNMVDWRKQTAAKGTAIPKHKSRLKCLMLDLIFI